MGVLTKAPVTPAAVPTSQVAETIANATVEVCRQTFGRRLTHIILTGSMARNEQTVLGTPGGWKVLGDAEFLLVFHRGVPLPAQADIDALSRSISELCAGYTVSGAIHLAAVHPGYLRRLPRHIFSYELKAKGRVIYGDPEILRLVPQFSPEIIEREDAWRMLSNRMIEWLENLAEVPDGQAEPGMAFFYSSVKLYIDSATSLLVFLGGYVPSYIERAEELKKIAWSTVSVPNLRLQLTQFAADVTNATSWKTSPDQAKRAQNGWPFCMAARDYASCIWSWELALISGANPALLPFEMVREWGWDIHFARRWRGWLRAAREVGWWRSRREWPRWSVLARRGSPRHWLYAAAAECVSRDEIFSPNQATVASSGLVLSRLRACLPVVLPEGTRSQDDWRALVRDLAWNYHHLVECTRA